MSKVNFFSNSLIVLSGKECQTTSSLRNTRDAPIDIFSVPEHSIGTNNLLVFVDGILKEPIRDYIDVSSYEVQFNEDIPIGSDFKSILISTEGEDGLGKDCEIHLKQNEF